MMFMGRSNRFCTLGMKLWPRRRRDKLLNFNLCRSVKNRHGSATRVLPACVRALTMGISSEEASSL